MTVLRSGRRRCDSSCHKARGKECHCICGGAHHGAAYRGGVRLPDKIEEEVGDDLPLFKEVR